MVLSVADVPTGQESLSWIYKIHSHIHEKEAVNGFVFVFTMDNCLICTSVVHQLVSHRIHCQIKTRMDGIKLLISCLQLWLILNLAFKTQHVERKCFRVAVYCSDWCATFTSRLMHFKENSFWISVHPSDRCATLAIHCSQGKFIYTALNHRLPMRKHFFPESPSRTLRHDLSQITVGSDWICWKS